MIFGLSLLICGAAVVLVIALLIFAFALGWIVRDFETWRDDDEDY